MKKLKLITPAIVLGLFLNSCSNNKSENQTESSDTKTEETQIKKTEETAQIKRPEKTEENLRKMVYKFDSKVADVSRTLRELKDNIEKGAKVTPKIEDNFNKMVADAKKLREPILPQSDSLAAEEFRQFDRDKDWIDQLDAEFESVKQTASVPK